MQNNDLAQLENIDMALITACSSARQALALCVRMSGHSDENIAEQVGISKGYLSKVLSGSASLDGDRRIKLMRVCGNRAPLQYEAWVMGLHASERSPEDLLREAMALLGKGRA